MPYLQMHELGNWLEQFAPGEIPASVVKRVTDLWQWAQEQPSGKDASDDIPTIVAVGLIEKLFRSSATSVLIPHLLTQEQLIGGASYLKQWVGEDDYYKAWTSLFNHRIRKRDDPHSSGCPEAVAGSGQLGVERQPSAKRGSSSH